MEEWFIVLNGSLINFSFFIFLWVCVETCLCVWEIVSKFSPFLINFIQQHNMTLTHKHINESDGCSDKKKIIPHFNGLF